MGSSQDPLYYVKGGRLHVLNVGWHFINKRQTQKMKYFWNNYQVLQTPDTLRQGTHHLKYHVIFTNVCCVSLNNSFNIGIAILGISASFPQQIHSQPWLPTLSRASNIDNSYTIAKYPKHSAHSLHTHLPILPKPSFIKSVHKITQKKRRKAISFEYNGAALRLQMAHS